MVVVVVANPPVDYSCQVHTCYESNEDNGAIPGGDERECVINIDGAMTTWQNVISGIFSCLEESSIEVSLCEWLRAAGDLVNQSIVYSSLDSRFDDITAAEFDRKYFPLVYGAQGTQTNFIKHNM